MIVDFNLEAIMGLNLHNKNLDFLFKAVLALENVEECYDFFEDLCTVQELNAISQRIVVATQTYHLYRALWSAKSLGMQATGVPSDYHEYQKQLQYDIREVPARTKDFFKALFRMPSTYVGDAISLDQDGDVTN